MGRFLIPANSKKSLLLFGLFNSFDMILFGSGIGVSMILIAILPVEQMTMSFLAITPALITGFLVFPVPNYHNVLTIILSALAFFTQNQKFIWKGWCVLDEYKDQKIKE